MRIKFTFLLLLLVEITFGQVYLKNFNIEKGEYFDETKYQFIERIIDTTYSNGTLTILLETYDNCSYSESNGYFEIVDDTIFLSYEQTVKTRIENGDTVEYTIYVFSDCPFLIKYEISNIKKQDYKFKLQNTTINYYHQRFKTFPIEFEIEQGDTINLTDKFGLKQGRWIEKDSLGNEISNMFYVNDDWKDGVLKLFHENGKLMRIYRKENFEFIEISEYDMDGKFLKNKELIK